MRKKRTSPTTIDMGLCPGVDIGAKRNERNRMDNTESSFEKEEEDLKGVRDIAEAVTTMLLSAESESLTGTSSSSSFLPLSQEIYLTSEAFIGQTTPSRAQMWGELLDAYQSSGRCDETFKTRLTWNGLRTNRPDLFPSQMQVVYNNIGETETDSGCALVLLLAISANPDVCSVEIRRGVEAHNYIAKFLTESEIVDVTPFETKGIDGWGQVVAVSDSGLDIDNCYFFDPDKPGAVGTSTGPGETIDPSHRKVVQYVPHVDSRDYRFGHGTHVCGTIAGKRFDGKGVADGIAPGAKIAFIDLADANNNNAKNFQVPNLDFLLNTGRPHAKIHSASWGAPSNDYSARTSYFDQFMFEVRLGMFHLVDQLIAI
jgi:subtilisin family serine protease